MSRQNEQVDLCLQIELVADKHFYFKQQIIKGVVVHFSISFTKRCLLKSKF